MAQSSHPPNSPGDSRPHGRPAGTGGAMGCPRPYRISLCRWAAAPVGPGGEVDGGQGDGPGVLVDCHGGGVFGPQCVFLHLKVPFPCTRRHVPLACSAASSLYPGSPRPAGWGPVFRFRDAKVRGISSAPFRTDVFIHTRAKNATGSPSPVPACAPSENPLRLSIR